MQCALYCTRHGAAPAEGGPLGLRAHEVALRGRARIGRERLEGLVEGVDPVLVRGRVAHVRAVAGLLPASARGGVQIQCFPWQRL